MRKIVIHSALAEMRALIRGMLSDIEALFVPIATREELFRVCRTVKYDLVLTDDAEMFLSDIEAVAKIRGVDALPQIFVLSHNLSEESVVALLAKGINQFIALPVAPERLYSKVSSRYHNLV